MGWITITDEVHEKREAFPSLQSDKWKPFKELICVGWITITDERCTKNVKHSHLYYFLTLGMKKFGTCTCNGLSRYLQAFFFVFLLMFGKLLLEGKAH